MRLLLSALALAAAPLAAQTLRITAGKQVAMLAVAAGFGWSRYTGHAYQRGRGRRLVTAFAGPDDTSATTFYGIGMRAGC